MDDGVDVVEWAGSARVVMESTEIRKEWAGSARVIKLTEREREWEVAADAAMLSEVSF